MRPWITLITTMLVGFGLAPTYLSYGQNESMRYSLIDAQGKMRTEAEWQKARAAVFFFIGVECPISNRYAPEINRLAGLYSQKGISFYAVHSDPDTETVSAKNYATAYGYKFPSLLDPEQQLSRRFHVVSTPTAVIVSPKDGVLYRGRIDDRYQDFGKARSAGVKPELQRALEAMLAGKPVISPAVPPIGCDLPPPRKTTK